MTEQDQVALPALQKKREELAQVVQEYEHLSQSWAKRPSEKFPVRFFRAAKKWLSTHFPFVMRKILRVDKNSPYPKNSFRTDSKDQAMLLAVNAALDEQAKRIDDLGQPINKATLTRERRRLTRASLWRFTHGVFIRARIRNRQRQLIHLALKVAYVPVWISMKVVRIAQRTKFASQQVWQRVVSWYRHRVRRSRTRPHHPGVHNRRLIRLSVFALVLEILCIVGLILLVVL